MTVDCLPHVTNTFGKMRLHSCKPQTSLRDLFMFDRSCFDPYAKINMSWHSCVWYQFQVSTSDVLLELNMSGFDQYDDDDEVLLATPRTCLWGSGCRT